MATRKRRKPAKRAATRAAKNPAGRGELMSERVLKITYIHTEDDQKYVHDFSEGVSMYVTEGRNAIVLRRPDGLPLADRFR